MLLSQSWFLVITKTQRGILFTRAKRGDLRKTWLEKQGMFYAQVWKKYTKRAKWCDDNPGSITIIKSKVEVSVKEISKVIIFLNKRQ